MLTNLIPIRTAAVSLLEYNPGLHSVYKFTSKFGDEVDMARVEGNMLAVPRQTAPIGMEDWRADPSLPAAIDCSKFVPTNDEQGVLVARSLALLKSGVDHVFEAPTGFGKCQIKGTKVLMYSGTKKRVEDVLVGDALMGPDGTPRRVLSLVSGVAPAYELRTPRGEVLLCNEDHILSLRCTGGSTYAEKGAVLHVTLKDWLGWPKYKKHCFKLWKPSVVQFERERGLPITPYILGLLLGDGGIKNGVKFTSADMELVNELHSEALRFGCEVRKVGGTDYGWSVSDDRRDSSGYGSNAIKDVLQDMGVHGKGSSDKRVPVDYLTASVEDRLQLIAGLIDTDGHHNHGSYDFISKSEQLSDDLCYLSWSVGLAAVKSRCEKECVNNGVWGGYYRVCISGDTHKVPCRLARKKAEVRKQIKNPLMHGFTAHLIGDEEYYGFMLDGDRQYLDGNFFVNHNSVCGAVIAAKLGKPTLIVVQKQDLVANWYKALHTILGIPANKIGKVQQDTCDYQGKWFVIGMVQSLIIPDRYPDELYRYFGLLVCDEVHTMAADCFVKICWKVTARHRLGFSATPDRSDGKWAVVEAHMGEVRVKGTTVPMTPKVLVKSTKWAIPNWGDTQIPHSPGRMMLVTKAQAASTRRNALIVEFVLAAYKAGRVTLVLSGMKEYHLDRLFKMLSMAGIPGQEIGYYVGGMKPHELEQTKKCRVVLATYQMCSTGTDVPHWDSLVMATPRSNIKQSVGRVLRYVEGKKQPVILDLLDLDKIFSSFFYSRLTQYYSLGSTIIRME